jgi:hypothetical protein
MVVEREREREKAHAHQLWQSGRGNLVHDDAHAMHANS